jgi:hypothetical protein
MISGIGRIGWIAEGSRFLSVDIRQKRLYCLQYLDEVLCICLILDSGRDF